MTRIQDRLARFYQRLRILQYRCLSDCGRVSGKPIVNQPVQMMGKGRIEFVGKVTLGFHPSAFFFSGYTYIEARSPNSVIHIEDGVCMNNNVTLVSEGEGIFIGELSMLGAHCEILDSDFHDLHPDRRHRGDGAKTGRVVIGRNVMIGSNVRIQKGVRIGDNSIISNGAVVTRSVPPNMIAFGNPARCAFGLVPEDKPAPQLT